MVSKPRFAVVETRGQFGNPEEWRRPLLEADTRKLAKTETEDASVCVTVICEV
jgi:hypothetical protein